MMFMRIEKHHVKLGGCTSKINKARKSKQQNLNPSVPSGFALQVLTVASSAWLWRGSKLAPLTCE